MSFGFFGAAGRGGSVIVSGGSAPEIAVSGSLTPGSTITLSASAGTLKSATVTVGGVRIPADSGFTYTLPVWATDASAIAITGRVETDDGETLAVSAPSAQTWVIPLATQSNMLGSAVGVGDDGVAWPAGVLMANIDGSTYTPGGTIVDLNGTTAPYSIAKHFAISFLTEHPGDTIIFVPAAVSGTGFASNDWNKGNALYNRLVDATNATLTANPGALPRAVLVQGFEHDCVLSMTAASFTAALEDFIDALRSDITGAGRSLPVVLGELASDFVGTDPVRVAIRDAALSTPSRKHFTAMASSRSPTVLPTTDGTHFSQAGLAEMGARQYVALASAEANAVSTAAIGLGGTISQFTDGNGQAWRVHSFTETGIFELTNEAEVDLLIVGGGGGGGYVGGGGGGGGGVPGAGFLRVRAKPGLHPIIIGAGGAKGGSAFGDRYGRKGSNSSAFGFVALGGGGGIGGNDNVRGQPDGGSGGGDGGASGSTQYAPGTGFDYQGFAGALGNPTGGVFSGGGGGGAGDVGLPPEDATNPGKGGDGVRIISFGFDSYVGGGGGGGGLGPLANGGIGGGGATGQPGAANTGGGGGGSEANGGSGFVAIRYRI